MSIETDKKLHTGQLEEGQAGSGAEAAIFGDAIYWENLPYIWYQPAVDATLQARENHLVSGNSQSRGKDSRKEESEE